MNSVRAQSPQLDLSFLPTEVYRPALVSSVQVQTDGKIVLAGRFTRLGTQASSGVARLLPSSLQPDASFAQNLAGLLGPVYKSYPLPNGQLLLAGNGYLTLNNVTRWSMLRLNADGTPDPTFDASSTLYSKFSAFSDAVRVQPDGKLLVAGRGPSGPSQSGYVLRLNPDGSPDTAFQAALGAAPNRDCTSLDLQPDGKILVGGRFLTIAGQSRPYVARLLPSGALDANFVPANLNSTIEQLGLEPGTGNVLLLLNTRSLVRLLPTGALDPAFQTGTNFQGSTTSIGSFTRTLFRYQPDGHILVNTSTTRYNGVPIGRLVRLLADGQLDPTFANASALAGEVAFADLAVLPGGQLLGGGEAVRLAPAGSLPVSLVRYSATGSFIPGLNLNPAYEGVVYDVVREPGGELLIGGDFTEINGRAAGYLARLRADGLVDTTYTVPARVDGPVLSLARQPDGRLVVGGRFDLLNGSPRAGIGRLMPDGSLDNTFAPATLRPRGQQANVRQVVLQPDGQLLLLGEFNLSMSATRMYYLARLNAAGQRDRSFTPVDTTGVNHLLVQPDGRIVAAGLSSTVFFGASVVTWRMLPNGTLDPNFVITALGAGASYSQGRTLTRDAATGDIYLGGILDGLFGTSSISVARLDAAGNPDASYRPTFPMNYPFINSLVLQPNGRLLVGGAWDAGNQSIGTARYLHDGQFDNSYQGFAGPSSEVLRLLLLPDGAIVAAGSFTSVSGLPISGLTKLLASNVLSAATPKTPAATEVWPSPAHAVLHVSMAAQEQPQQLTILDALGRVVLQQAVTNPQTVLALPPLPIGPYILRIHYARSVATKRFMVD